MIAVLPVLSLNIGNILTPWFVVASAEKFCKANNELLDAASFCIVNL